MRRHHQRAGLPPRAPALRGARGRLPAEPHRLTTAPAITESLRELLLGIPERIDLQRIDRLWVFPPRVAAGRERGLVVASLIPDPGEPHPLLNVRYESAIGTRPPRPLVEIEEVGRAPGPTVAHVVRAAAARLAEPEQPVELDIGGDPARWRSELTRLGIVAVDPPCGE